MVFSSCEKKSVPPVGGGVLTIVVPQTLLIGRPQDSWRGWLDANGRGGEVLCLDPANADYGPPGRVFLLREGKVAAWRFVGCLTPQRDPIGLMAAATSLLRQLDPDGWVWLFGLRASPVVRRLALALAQVIAPGEIVVPEGSRFEREGWPVGARTVPLEEPLPGLARSAQRRARWLELREACELHQTPLDSVRLVGARLGCGEPVPTLQRKSSGIDWVLHAEVAGSTALLVARHEPADAELAHALDVLHATKAVVVRPDDYVGLLCSFARQNGDDFGMGFVESIDFEERLLRARCTAVPPAPVRLVRLGALAVDPSGKELGEARPWAV